MQDKEARISIFNKSGKVIGYKARKDVNKITDTLGSINIIVSNTEDNTFMIIAKDSIWGNKWGGSCAGLIRMNESPEQAAKRTLERELGINIPLKFVSKQYVDFEGVKRWFHVFYGISSKVNPNKEDVLEGKWVSRINIIKMIEDNVIMPTFKLAYSKITNN